MPQEIFKILSQFIFVVINNIKKAYVYKLGFLVLLSLIPLNGFAFDVEEDLLYYPEPEHKEELEFYINKFCVSRGRAFVRIQNKITVDCMTSNVLWKVGYADDWSQSLAEALRYPIYDDYRGDEEYAPISGVVLVQEDADDYRNMLQLKQLVKYYKLPVKLETMENYGVSTNNKPKSRFIKNFQIDFGS